MGGTQQAVTIDSRGDSLDLTIRGDAGQQRVDIRPLPSADSLLKRAIWIVARRMHLDLGHYKTSAILNHLPSQARHQACNEQQHRIAERDCRHSNKSTPAIAPEVTPREL